MIDPQENRTSNIATESAQIMQKSKLATTALILGIPGVCLFPLGIVALVLGIVALVQTNDPQRRLTGKGAALAGTILGGISIVLIPILALFAGILLPALSAARSAAMEARDAINLQQISVAVQMYEMDYGVLPDHPRELLGYLGNTQGVFISPVHDPSTPLDRGDSTGPTVRYGSYVFLRMGVAPDSVEFPAHTVIAFTAKVNERPRRRAVLFMDGHVELVKEEDMMYFLPMEINAASLDGP